MTKIKNSSHSRQPIHTVDGVRHIGARKTRSFELSKPGEKLVKASDALSIVSDEKPKKPRQKPAEDQEASTGSEETVAEGDRTPEKL